MIVDTKQHQLEAISLFICVIAASIGPIFLINAQFTINFPIGGLMYAIVSAFLYRLLYAVEGKYIPCEI